MWVAGLRFTAGFPPVARGSVVTVPAAPVSSDGLSGASSWRTFRDLRTRNVIQGCYWSAADQCSVIYESRLEQRRLFYADFDLSVGQIVAKPFILSSHGLKLFHVSIVRTIC
jgi:hypothetical protein